MNKTTLEAIREIEDKIAGKMTPQEALERVLDATCEDDYQISCSVHRPDDEEIKVLQQLVDRATPKKPIVQDGNEYVECPNCESPLENRNHCGDCGQAIERSKDE